MVPILAQHLTPAPDARTHAFTPVRLLAKGQLHELHADIAGWAAALLFALSQTGRQTGTATERDRTTPILLVRCRTGARLPTVPYGEALAQSGIDPARLILVDAADNATLLRAGLEGARTAGLAAVVLETWGAMRDYDLVASRRLVLAAETTGVPVILLRGSAQPRPSAAHTRWQVTSAPSAVASMATPIPLIARLPGPATIALDLLRQRGGPAGATWRLEWNDHDACFHDAPLATSVAAPRLFGAVMAGTVVSLAALRKDVGPDQSARQPDRQPDGQTGRRADSRAA